MHRSSRLRRAGSAEDSRSLWFSAPLTTLALLATLAAASAAAAAEDDAGPAHQVGAITITATRAERDILEVPGNVTVIEREQIEQSGARNAAELMRLEAGLSVTNTTTNPDGLTVEARGFNDGGGAGSNLLVLVNGRRVNEPDSSSPDWAWLSVDNIERIEVVRGVASALYGDNAVSGVVHVITRDGEGPPEATATGRGGSFETGGGSLYAGGSAGPVSGTLFFDGITSGGYRDRSDFSSHREEGSLRVALGEVASIGLTGGYSSDSRDRPGALSAEDIYWLGRRAASPSTEGDVLDRERWHLDGQIEWSPSKQIAVKLVPFYNERTDNAVTTIPVPLARYVTDTEVWSGGLNAQLQLDHEFLGVSNRVIVGTDILRDEVDQDFVGHSDAFPEPWRSKSNTERHFYAAFVQDELNFKDRLLLSVGVRFDYTRFHGVDEVNDAVFAFKGKFWSPRCSLTYRVVDPVAVYAAYARGFRFPTPDQAFGFYGYNPELNEQKSNSYEMGVKVRAEHVSLDVAGYWMDVDDQIVFNHEIDNPDYGYPEPRNVNMDRVWHRGLEASVQLQPIERLRLFGTYTLQKTEIRRDSLTHLEGKELPLTPRHSGTLGARLALPYWIELGVDAKFTGSRYLVNDLRNEFEEDKISKHATWDLLFAFRPEIRKYLTLDLSFAVRNLFDRKYNEFAGERSFERGVFGYYPSPTRSYQAVARVTVKR